LWEANLSEQRGSVDNRDLIPREALQEAITAGVKKADPSCAPFIGVIVQRAIATSSLEANWTIRGIKYGRANRDKADAALATIVERMQHEFSLSDDRKVTKMGEVEG
jgi:hypothetical protein